jgi:hypothetical protein
MTEQSLLYQWAVCGIAAAAARFVPVPLLDDVIRQRATQFAVMRTLRAHDQDVPSEALEPLWGEVDGRSSGLLGRARKVSRDVLLLPVRTYVKVFGAVRGVPTDVARVVLLGRSVERRLGRGELSQVDRATQEARALRRAVEQAMDGLDLRLLTAGLGDGLSQTKGLSAAAVAFARRRFTKAQPETDLAPDGPLAESAGRVTEVLRRPEIAQLLDRFDTEVDLALSAGRR